MTRIKIHISNVKLPFYPPCEVKCRLQNRVSTVFCSSYNFSGILVILDTLRGYFGRFRGLELFWSFQSFQGIFGHFRGFGLFVVILEVSGYLWSFQRFSVCFGHFKGLGVFLSLYGFKGISVIFQVLGVFWSFLGFRDISVILQVSNVFQLL